MTGKRKKGPAARPTLEDIQKELDRLLFQLIEAVKDRLGTECFASAAGYGPKVLAKSKDGESAYVLIQVPENGQRQLSSREREIVLLVAEGLENKEIADRLGIKASTVNSHLRRIFTNFGIHTRAGLALRALSLD